MRIYLVSPPNQAAYWSLSEIWPIVGRQGYLANLALPTLAALTPPGHEIVLCDETCGPADLDRGWDLVGITGYTDQRPRMLELATAARRAGAIVAMGGPCVSLSPHRFREAADVLFIGEAEETWPRFLADLEAGRAQDVYVQAERVDLQRSPVPRHDLLGLDRYVAGSCQTTRGCPYSCEFCDVAAYLGRRVTHKPVEQVLTELNALYRAGVRQVFLCDDNLTVDRGYARELLEALSAQTVKWSEPVEFSTQASIDLARSPELMDLCAEAGLRHVLVGIESPNRQSLVETGKLHNARTDLVGDVRRMQERGLVVHAAMIVGFDADRLDIFEQHFGFLQEAEVPVPQLGMLSAHEGSALERRLRAEGRLVEQSNSEINMDTWATNVKPLQMSRAELRTGFEWLLNRLFRPDTFLSRLESLAARLPDLPVPAQHRSPELGGGIGLVARLYRSFSDLGPEFAAVCSRGLRLAGRKPAHASQMIYLLLFYRHLVGLLRRWGLWNPTVGPHPFTT
jgi:radical SAM superfamily enzyme YgiQ (UPF0313 family)